MNIIRQLVTLFIQRPACTHVPKTSMSVHMLNFFIFFVLVSFNMRVGTYRMCAKSPCWRTCTPPQNNNNNKTTTTHPPIYTRETTQYKSLVPSLCYHVRYAVLGSGVFKGFYFVQNAFVGVCNHGRIQRWGGRVSGPTLKNHKNIGFFNNTRPDPLKNQKDTKPLFNVGPSAARQRNAI